MNVRNAILFLALMVLLVAGFWPGPAAAHEEAPFGAALDEGAGERASSFRQHPRMGRRGQGGPLGPPAEGLRLALRRLDLNEQQRIEIEAILESERDQIRSGYEQMHTLGAEFREQIETDPFDEEAVRAKAAALASLRVETAVVRARQLGQIRGVLTTAQRDRLERMKEERKAFRGEGWHRRGPRRQGRPEQ